MKVIIIFVLLIVAFRELLCFAHASSQRALDHKIVRSTKSVSAKLPTAAKLGRREIDTGRDARTRPSAGAQVRARLLLLIIIIMAACRSRPSSWPAGLAWRSCRAALRQTWP